MIPRSNGSLRIDFEVSVRNRVQRGMVLGPHGRMLQELRQDLKADLSKFYQRPVVLSVTVVIRSRPLEHYSQTPIVVD